MIRISDHHDDELNNLSMTLDADLGLLTEERWHRYLSGTQPYYYLENELHDFLKAAYQRIKQLESDL